MKKGLLIFVFICLYALITFFGLGPVIFADGSNKERMITLIIVLILYFIITFILRKLLRLFQK